MFMRGSVMHICMYTYIKRMCVGVGIAVDHDKCSECCTHSTIKYILANDVNYFDFIPPPASCLPFGC